MIILDSHCINGKQENKILWYLGRRWTFGNSIVSVLFHEGLYEGIRKAQRNANDTGRGLLSF